jgi:hypothetical protein
MLNNARILGNMPHSHIHYVKVGLDLEWRMKGQEKDIKVSKDFLITKIEDHQVNIEN